MTWPQPDGVLCRLSKVLPDERCDQLGITNNVLISPETGDFHVSVGKHINFHSFAYPCPGDQDGIGTMPPEREVNIGCLQIGQQGKKCVTHVGG